MIAIDTNILICSLDRTDLVKRSKARALIRQLRSRSHDVVIPWQVMGEFVRYLRSLQDQRTISRTDFERILGGYRRLFVLAMPTPHVLDHAIALTSRHSLSHWDSMLLGGCWEASVDTLYTEDMGAPIVIEGITLINPFT
jgi:predicted nucleic acid-binding protein